MATAWKVAAAIAVVGWLVSPIVTLALPKILSFLGFDAEKKLRELQINIIPELENTLLAVDQERMLGRGEKPKSDVSTLDNMAGWLRHARDEAEDIFDDAQEIELYRNRWLQRLCGAVKACIVLGFFAAFLAAVIARWVIACIARCLGILRKQLGKLADKLVHRLDGGMATCKSRCMRLLRWVRKIKRRLYGGVESRMWIALQWPGKIIRECWHRLCVSVETMYRMWIAGITRSGLARLQQWARRMRSPQDVLPVNTGAVTSDRLVPVATNVDALNQPIPVTPSDYFDGAVSEQSAPVITTAVASDGLVPVTTTPAASDKLVPVTTTPMTSVGPSHELVSVTTGAAATDEPMPQTTSVEPPAPVTVPSKFLGWCLSGLFGFFYFINKQLGFAIGFAYFLRDWSYEVIGITANQENAHMLDFVLTAVSRRNLKKRIEKLESTVSEVKKSTLLSVRRKSTPDDTLNKNRFRIRTTSTRKVFGREALRDSIMAKLRETPDGDAPSSSTCPCYSAIGIYGVAGSGKTTFARYIRDYIKKQRKEEKLFDTIMCIHVSETLRVKDIFHEMLEDVTKDRHSNIADLKDLKKKLKESVRGKRFFLILDDLWVKSKNDPQLEELISPLNVGLKGSKILVTARTKVSAGALCADEPMEMPDLAEDHYLSMFMHYSLGGTNVPDEEFKRVGRMIAGKLHGSPIAAVTVAGRLGVNRDIKFWRSIADRDMLNDTMDALWWSYQQLSSDIKRCFEYCNIFPRRSRMKKGELVHLWVAQGFIKTSSAREDMEHVAEDYIQELVSCSFLQPEKTWNNEECFRIHDLLHDLADMVTGTDCFRVENKCSKRGEIWKGDIPRDVCHLFIQNYDAELLTEETLGSRNLRTLIINAGIDTQVVEKFIDSVCRKLPKLRVLAFLSNWEYDPNFIHRNFSLPESVGQLKHLRYFALRTNSSYQIYLPSTLNKLQHIQLLDFGEGNIWQFSFPQLVNLRHIFCSQNAKFAYICRMNSLQTLPVFKVSSEQGCELKQLRDLNKLQGKLCIGGLENVKSKGQALQANLSAKLLTELTLRWGYDDGTRCTPEVKSDVLEGLCPPVGLQKLVLYSFVGCRYPDWMVGKHIGGPKYLQELHLWRCSQSVPDFGLAEAFPYLRDLKLYFCSWDDLPENMEHLTSLKDLWISSCKNIRLLPTLPQSLEDFRLWKCNDEFTKSCETVGHPNWQKIKHIPEKTIY